MEKINKEIIQTKQIRKDLDSILQKIKNLKSNRSTALSITKIQEGIMWLGMSLKELGEEDPYPSSKDPSTGNTIEPTADNLKL